MDEQNLKPKTWIVPMRLSVYVDDPNKYDAEMESFVKNTQNELRSTMASVKGKVSVEFAPAIKDQNAWNMITQPQLLIELIQNTIKEALRK